MTLTYLDGRAVEAVLLARTETTLRVVVQGADDVIELSAINGTWVAPGCEPVGIEFAWQRLDRKPKVSEIDCHCTDELATRLIRLLLPTGATAECSGTYTLGRKYDNYQLASVGCAADNQFTSQERENSRCRNQSSKVQAEKSGRSIGRRHLLHVPHH
jgi:hypothetical protein